MQMTYSDAGLTLTQTFEGCRLMPYKDGGGVLTNGYGNTHDVTDGLEITQEQAEADLIRNIQSAVHTVNSSVTVDLTQGQFDSCVDFVFNLGSGSFRNSTLLKRLNVGDYDGACSELAFWVHNAGKICPGLQRRREAEQKQWEVA